MTHTTTEQTHPTSGPHLAEATSHPVSTALPYGPRDVTGQRQVAWQEVGRAWPIAGGKDGLHVTLAGPVSVDMLPHLVITQAPDPAGERSQPVFTTSDSRLNAFEVLETNDENGRQIRWVRIGHANRSDDERGYTLHVVRIPQDLKIVLLSLKTGTGNVDMQAAPMR